MSDLVKVRQIGNSDGLTFRSEGLRVAGIARGDQVRVDYKPGRIEITTADDVRARCREGFELFTRRYDRALHILAK